MKKFILKSDELYKLNPENIRNYVVLTKIYRDLNISLDSFLAISTLKCDQDIKKHLNNENLQYYFLQLVSHIYEANIFLDKELKYNKGGDRIRNQYFKDIRNNIGYHYNNEKTDLPLYKIFVDDFFINQNKDIEVLLNTNNYKGIFPSTTELVWLFVYIIDVEKKWKNYLINKPEIIKNRISNLSSGDQEHFVNWFNEAITKIIETSNQLLKTCSKELTSMPVEWADQGNYPK